MSLTTASLLFLLAGAQIAGWTLGVGQDSNTGKANVVLSRSENGRVLRFSCNNPKTSNPAIRFAYVDQAYVGRRAYFQPIVVQLDNSAPMEVMGSYEPNGHVIEPPIAVSTEILDRLGKVSTVRVQVINARGEAVNARFNVSGSAPALEAFKKACY